MSVIGVIGGFSADAGEKKIYGDDSGAGNLRIAGWICPGAVADVDVGVVSSGRSFWNIDSFCSTGPSKWYPWCRMSAGNGNIDFRDFAGNRRI